MRTRIRSILFLMVGLLILGGTSAQRECTMAADGSVPQAPAELSSAVQLVLAARESSEMREAYERLFALESKCGIRSLRQNPNIGIALQGAWQELVPFGTEPDPLASFGPRDWQKLAWFL